MPELEDQLTALAGSIGWPATPQFRVVIPVQRRAGWAWARPLALAAAAVIVVAAALLAFPPSRDAVANWLNLHTVIHRVQTVPTPSPLPSGTVGQRLGLGAPVTRGQAQSKVGWKIAVPSSLGAPDEVYYQAPPTGPSQGEVSLVYTSATGINVSGTTGVSVLITEARGKTEEGFFGKMLGNDATYEVVSVGSHSGYWISGKPHDFAYTDADGNFRFETMRLATNTLIFDDNGTIVRIEGDMTKDQALQIAASMG
jgi:hypothetical protein